MKNMYVYRICSGKGMHRKAKKTRGDFETK